MGMDDLIAFFIAWIIAVGGIALFLFTVRVILWLIEVILIRGW
jgi:hypothetical protein